MDNIEILRRAREARQQKVAAQKYSVTWRGGAEPQLVGIAELPSILKLKLPSIRCYLSKGGGTFTLQRPNPVTLEPDIVTVQHIASPAKPKPRRGRPLSAATLAMRIAQATSAKERDEYQRQLQELRLRHVSCNNAKTMPKTRNRRTDEKR